MGVLTTLVLLFSSPAHAAEVRVAVASNFLSTLQQLAAVYHNQQSDRLMIISGSSGGLYAQIRHGAPYDLFLSADQNRPERLEKEGVILPGSRRTYARGLLALWSDDPLQVDREGAVLHSGTFQHLSLPNPVNAPYGLAAQQLLSKKGLWRTLEAQKRLIRTGNVRQTLFQVVSGAAPMGFIALSQAHHPVIAGKGSLWVPDPSLYPPIIQQGVVLARSQQPQAALRFMHWLQSQQARALIAASGYQVGLRDLLLAGGFPKAAW
ncbi:molybdate ABC transporter substrate-binding protein [Oceanospirillum linum]|uniref:Molybdate ABC transporter substrate-binding protein n=1 Tax=Oceanospirillum linum TaxID=966 RepID=A0A1T1HDK2_OCELI|nr:molybdate ABC transporter substrate-binding protein [Oceanospirillum linum]